MPPTIDVLVTFYNQKQYIAECLESILAQRGDFDMRVIISDDGSTDGSAEVLKQFAARYPKKIKLLLQDTNRGIAENKKILMKAADATYIATCDGDDYWCDEYKLQKQLAFLENNPAFSICYTRCRRFNEKTKEVYVTPDGQYMRHLATSNRDDFLDHWGYAYSTMFFRRSSFDTCPFDQIATFDHTYIIYQSLCYGQGQVLDFVGSVYRLHEQNVFAHLSETEQCAFNVPIFIDILRQFPDDRYMHQRLGYLIYRLAWDANHSGDKQLAGNYLSQLADVSPEFFLNVPYKGYALARKLRKWQRLLRPSKVENPC